MTHPQKSLPCLIEKARRHVMTPEEYRLQRLSFIRGLTQLTDEQIFAHCPELAPSPASVEKDVQIARLRNFALELIRDGLAGDYKPYLAIIALSPADESAWKPWRDVIDEGVGNWFHFREDDDTRTVDQVSFAANGKIDGKYGCGLEYYTECQPCTFDAELAAAVAHFSRNPR